ISLPVRPQTSSSDRRPTLCGPVDSIPSPSLAMTRFSPTSGTTSASVPIAAIFTNAGSHPARPDLRHRACTSLSATPTPVAQALGDEMDHVRAEELEGPPKDDGGGDAVHVVIAMDRDALPARNRA